ncbi:MAG: hypothetical protein HWQ43_19750 [Nostoc sp. JL31]|uniref:hypothetical protein n=1 Tax=Nostoc sp. JL31 TaxID=2815395 RepID=UPI0025D0631F|nr:hypothetical protein [Nostoc sp. JL31]MBN3891289.1 hypothetical protein [Nostoc sp. JL31]
MKIRDRKDAINRRILPYSYFQINRPRLGAQGLHWCQLNAKWAVRNRVYTNKTHLRGFQSFDLTLVRGGGLCLCSCEFHDSAGEFIGGLTHHYLLLLISLIGVRFNGLELLARNLFQGGKGTPNQGFRGEGSNPSRIRQQSHSIC